MAQIHFTAICNGVLCYMLTSNTSDTQVDVNTLFRRGGHLPQNWAPFDRGYHKLGLSLCHNRTLH